MEQRNRTPKKYYLRILRLSDNKEFSFKEIYLTNFIPGKEISFIDLFTNSPFVYNLEEKYKIIELYGVNY